MNPEALPLRDIHLPEAVGWWPPAPGWWLLTALAIGLVVAAVLRARRRRPAANTVDPAIPARRALAALQADYERHRDASRLAAELSVLLRRTVLSGGSPRRAAGLTGAAWLELLDARAGAPLFSRGPGRALLDAPYRPASEPDVPGLLAACARAIDGGGKARAE